MQVPTYTDIATTEFTDRLEERLRMAVKTAFNRQRAKHLSGSGATARLLMADDYADTATGSAAHAISVKVSRRWKRRV